MEKYNFFTLIRNEKRQKITECVFFLNINFKYVNPVTGTKILEM